MQEDIEITVALTRSEIAGYNFFHIKWLLLLDTLGLAGLAVMTYFAIFGQSQSTRDLFGSLLFWGVIILAVGLSQPLILFMQIYVINTPAMSAQRASRRYLFNSDGIRIESEGISVLKEWSRITVVKDIGRLILIFTSPKLAYVIPKRCFESQESRESFERLLLSKTAGNKKPGQTG